jgi:hypothetical protein
MAHYQRPPKPRNLRKSIYRTGRTLNGWQMSRVHITHHFLKGGHPVFEEVGSPSVLRICILDIRIKHYMTDISTCVQLAVVGLPRQMKYASVSSVFPYHFRIFSRPDVMESDTSANLGDAAISPHRSWRNSRIGIVRHTVGCDWLEKVCCAVAGSWKSNNQQTKFLLFF